MDGWVRLSGRKQRKAEKGREKDDKDGGNAEKE